MKTAKQLRAENNALRTSLRACKAKRDTWRFNFFVLAAFVVMLLVAQTFGIGVFR